MKKPILLTIMLLMGLVAAAADRNAVREAQAVIERTFGEFPRHVVMKAVPAEEGQSDDYFQYEVRRGVLRIEANNTIALCRGFYDYILRNGYGIASWSGNRLELPERLPDCGLRRVESPFSHRLYYNVCTNGYTTPFWGWEEWEREIDWMALHGFDMPLAPIAGEAIFARVWRDMGLSDEEINAYFTGPAHMPWLRMGNMTELDGAPTAEWHEAQIALQHKILDRMRALGMKPVYQGFAGFVPKAMKEHYPGVDIIETSWSGFNSYMLSPLDSLFSEVERRYIEAWEAEFGKGKYYLIDSFNELEIPFGEKGSPERADLLRRYSTTIYNSLSSANPDAVWVMQGWMFGYQRHIWDPQSIEALLSGVPDDKMLLIDLAVDFNRFVWRTKCTWEYVPGLFGKNWIYSTTPNFGGRSALTGVLENYANGHLDAFKSPDRGNLVGYGTSPEGIEQNEIIYEVIADAAWRDTELDLEDFLARYSAARYGACPDRMRDFWRGLLNSVYDRFTNQARYKWQLRPISGNTPTMGINDEYFKAIESFLACADELGDNRLYRNDAVYFAALYLGARADEVLDRINWAYVSSDTSSVEELENRFFGLLADADRLLESHPILRLQRWEEMAKRAGRTDAERDLFIEESRRLITVWGGPSLSDYSARVWSGVIRDFYMPRWQKYFAALRDGRTFNFRKDDEHYHTTRGFSFVAPFADPLGAARRLVSEASALGSGNSFRPADAVGFVLPFHYSREKITAPCSMLNDQYRKATGLRYRCTHGKDTVHLNSVTLRGHNETLCSMKIDRDISAGEEVVVPFVDKVMHDELALQIHVRTSISGPKEADNYISVELIYE